MVILNEDRRQEYLRETLEHLRDAERDWKELRSDLAKDEDKRRPLNTSKLMRVMEVERELLRDGEKLAEIIRPEDNKRYHEFAGHFKVTALYALSGLITDLEKTGNFAEAAKYHERARDMNYELVQLQQQAMQQQKAMAAQGGRGKEGKLEKEARRAVGEEESTEQEGGPRYDSEGRQYEHAKKRERRTEHRGGGKDFRYSEHGNSHYSLSALTALAGVAMIMLTGMPHLTGGVIGGSASGYVNMLGGFLILFAIGLYFVKRNRL